MNSLPVQPVATTPRKFNKIWIIVIILLILLCLCLLVVGVAAYFYIQKSNLGIGNVFNATQTPQSNEVKPGAEIRSEDGGYSFKMIPDYKINTFMSMPGVTLLIPTDNHKDMIGDGPEIALVGWVNSTSLSFEESASQDYDQDIKHYKATRIDEQQVSVLGLKGIAYDYEYEISGAGKIKAREIYVMVNAKQIFMIDCKSREGDWDKTLADFETLTNSVTFFEPIPSPTLAPVQSPTKIP